MIQAAINGMRNADYHPRLPLNAEQAARECQLSVSAGAESIHVHVWRDDGVESLGPADVAQFLEAICAACPGTPIGISTGEWIVPDLAERLRLIEAWALIPDFVSLNIHEKGFDKVADLLWQVGVDIEAGIFDLAAAQTFREWSERNRCLRILIEPEETTVEEATATVEAIESILDRTVPTLPRLLHGADNTAWPMIRLAAVRGYDTRIGFEDTASLPDGRMAQDNGELVNTAFDEMKRTVA